MICRAIFFDRDGVLNVNHGYVATRDRFEWQEGAKAAIKVVNDAGFLAIVVTNQSGVGRGYYTVDDVYALHAWMNLCLANEGAHIDAFYLCPYHPGAIIECYRVEDHPDRKPNPGMLLKAISEHNIDPANSFLIGDSPSDLEAARRAGIAGYLFSGGNLETMVRTIVSRYNREDGVAVG